MNKHDGLGIHVMQMASNDATRQNIIPEQTKEFDNFLICVGFVALVKYSR